MTFSIPPVLVAGAGPSGLVTALTLLQNRVPVRIIDKELQYRAGQRNHALWPRTFEVFHFLRVHEIHKEASSMLPVREYKPGTIEPTKTFFLVPHNDPVPSIPFNNRKSFGQPGLECILRSHLEKYGCSVELGTELESFKDDGERVFSKLVKRKDGEVVSETFEASYLIGADGAKGNTRKQLGIRFLGEARPDFVSVTGDICIEIEGIDRDHWHFFGVRSDNFCMLRPSNQIAPDGFNFLIRTNDYEPQQLIADQTLLFRCMSELTGKEIKVRRVVVLSEFRPNIRMADSFGLGRSFIVGDAAHVHSPTGGQGLNTSVQDALNLAWKVSMVYKGLSLITLLDSYAAERLPVIAEMLNITTEILNKMWKKQTVEGSMEKGKRLNMLGVNYRTSPIVVDEYTRTGSVDPYGSLEEGALVAGDRAPDAPSLRTASDGEETSLFDVFSATHHTALVFTPDTSSTMTTDVLDVLGTYPKDTIRPVIILPQGSNGTAGSQVDVVVDYGGHAYRAYLVAKGEQKVVVVRPDGVAGAIVYGVEGVREYRDKVFVRDIV